MTLHNCKTLISRIFKNPSNHPHLQIPHFYNAFSLLSTVSEENPKSSNPVYDYFVQKHKFSPETASKAASALSHLKTSERCDSILSFLQKFGFSKPHLETLVNNRAGPIILCARLDKTIKPKFETFQKLGFSDSDIISIVSDNPWLLSQSADDRIYPNLLVLKNFLGSVTLVAKLLKFSAWFFKFDLEKILLPNIEFLNRGCGIEMEQLNQHIFRFPRLFLHKPEYLRKIVERVDELGFNRESKMYLYAITTVSSMNDVNWQKKLELVRSLGFTEDEIFRMFRKAPHAFAVSPRRMNEVVQVILTSGTYDISDIVKHPVVFTCSVENKLKPRLQVLEILRDRNQIKKKPGFSAIYKLPDEKFIQRFVTPHLDELGDTHKLLKTGTNTSLVK